VKKIMDDQNYYSTFIEVADDCPLNSAEIPEQKSDGMSVPALQYELISENPYLYTQEDIIFEVFVIRNEIVEEDFAAEREKLFSRGQPCLRSSSLGKRYGWGIHCNEQGRVAIYAMESDEYRKFASDPKLKHMKAMRSKRV